MTPTTAVYRQIRDWVRASLRRKLIVALVATMSAVSLCFLVLLVGYYRVRLIDERSVTTSEINRLLQAALENAMLKRDIEGLRNIVSRLGAQEKIAGVMILNPKGEVRFASSDKQLGQRYDLSSDELCPGCGGMHRLTKPHTAFISGAKGADILRSVNPVRNRPPCIECHGAVESNPINGILIVDYAAAGIKREALAIALALSGAGAMVVLAAVGGIGLIIRRSVLRPVELLTTASRALSRGDLGQRVNLPGRDELAELGQTFNEMVARLDRSLSDIREREGFLQSLIDAIPDGVRVIDQNYRVIKANRAFCEQQGLMLSDIVGRTCHETSHARDTPCRPTLVTCPVHELVERSDSTLKRSDSALICRHRHVRADGREFYVEVSAALLSVSLRGEQHLLVVEAIRDLSKEMRLSQEQRLSEIGMLAVGVTHEIRNPLSSIHLSLSGLSDALTESQHPKVRDCLKVIDDEVNKCVDVTDRLLRLSVPPSELPELVSFNDIIPAVMSLLNAEAEQSDINVAIALEQGLRVIASDNDMRMLVLNIAQNAFHAMPRGGQLRIVGSIVGANVELTFDDTGVGIRPEDIRMIFEPFWSRRADGVRGTGLGLAICREIVNRFRGRIEVSSEVDCGTRFTILLPWADTANHRRT